MAAGVGWVGVDEIVGLGLGEGLAEIAGFECPVGHAQDLGDVADLVGDFGDVGLGEAFRFVAVGDVETAFAIEADYAVETGTVEEEKIQGRGRGVEAGADFVVVGFALGF